MRRYESYKDSGVEWLGEVPHCWDVKKVKNIFHLIVEPAAKNNQCELLSVYTDIGVKPRAELEERGNKASTTDGYWIVKKGDIVVNKLLAWMGAIGLSEYDGVTSPAYDILRPHQQINGKFFHYLFRTPLCLSEFKKNSRGIMDMRLRLYFEELGNIYIPFPSYPEQQKIAQFLDDKTAKIDQAVDLAEKQIALLKEHKQILIQNAVTQGLNPDVSLKDSGVEWIGQVPEHWEVSSLGKMLLPVSEKNKPNLPLLSITRELGVIERDVEDQESNHNFIPDDLSNYKVLKEGQFGMNKMKAWQGSYGVSRFTGIVSPAYYIFDFIKSVNSRFFHWAIRSKIYISFFGSASDGVRIGQWDLSKSRMKSIPFIIPSYTEQVQIADYLDQQAVKIDQAIALKTAHIEKLKEYKSVLINDVVTGKVRVSV